jgi:hypothetical protein
LESCEDERVINHDEDEFGEFREFLSGTPREFAECETPRVVRDKLTKLTKLTRYPVTRAARAHGALDAAQAETMARDGRSANVADPGHGGALLPSRKRLTDLRTMDRPKRPRVLLTTLSVRTSAAGRQYLSGFLAKARVVAFEGEPDRFGNPTWDLFLSEPEPRDGAASTTTTRSTPP